MYEGLSRHDCDARTTSSKKNKIFFYLRILRSSFLRIFQNLFFQCKILSPCRRHPLCHRHHWHVCLNHVKFSLEKKLINKQKEIFHHLNKEEIPSEKKPKAKVGIRKHAVFSIIEILCFMKIHVFKGRVDAR